MQNETKLLKKSEIREVLFLAYNECAKNQSFHRFNDIFSSKLNETISSKLNRDQLLEFGMKSISMKSQIAKFDLFEALQGQFSGKEISREQFDELNSKPTNVEKVKNLGNNILDITVNKLFNSPLNEMYDKKYVEHNTTARNKNTFRKRLKELKQIANSPNGFGI